MTAAPVDVFLYGSLVPLLAAVAAMTTTVVLLHRARSVRPRDEPRSSPAEQHPPGALSG